MHTEGSETGGGVCEPPLAPTVKNGLQYKTHNAPPGVDIPRGILGLGLHVYTLNYFWTPIQGYIYTWMYMYRYV
jgi:hypothetical protein